jgi:hypothetical protein
MKYDLYSFSERSGSSVTAQSAHEPAWIINKGSDTKFTTLYHAQYSTEFGVMKIAPTRHNWSMNIPLERGRLYLGQLGSSRKQYMHIMLKLNKGILS